MTHASARTATVGYRRLAVLLRRTGYAVNHQRVYRWYRREGLAVRRRQRKRIASTQRPVLTAPQQAGQEWAMDYIRGRRRTYTL